MRQGTKSLLFGCHQFIIHPICVLEGWIRLYGWRTLNFQVLLAIVTHDWGYWGCRSMDGPGGRDHPIRLWKNRTSFMEARWEVRFHSRHRCNEKGVQPSRLCWADKLGTSLMPSILWAVLAAASREGWEYMSNPFGNDYVKAEEFTLLGLRRFHKSYKKAWGIGGKRWLQITLPA